MSTARTDNQSARNRLPQADTRSSFRTRLLSVSGLIVGASLATAVGSTTLTGLLLGDAADVIIAEVVPATQPVSVAPATQPIAAAVTPIQDVLPSIARVSLIGFDDADRVSLGIDTHQVDGVLHANKSVGQTNTIFAGGAAASQADHAAPVRDAIRAAFETTYTGTPGRARPVTFGGSPDLVDAFRSFRASELDNGGYHLPNNGVISDAVPALGMDDPDAQAGNNKPTPRKPRRPAKSDSSSDSLTWESGVNARPNGELAPIDTGPVDGPLGNPTYDNDPFSGWTDEFGVFHPDPNYGAGGETYVPEPTTLLTLGLLLAGASRRRRR